MIKNDLLLSQYVPRSELIVEEHQMSQPYKRVIDVHTHFGRLGLGEEYEKKFDTLQAVEKLKEQGVKRVINLDGDWGPYLKRMLQKTKGFEDFFIHFGTVDLSKLEDVDFEAYVRQTIIDSIELGIKGLKFWKNLGLNLKDSKGKYIPVDHPGLEVIWKTAAEFKLPVLMHIADPIAFFKPIDRHNERFEELIQHPDWSFYGSEWYTFEQLMTMQENIISKNPETTFVIAHLGSCAENLAYVGSCFDRYPNMYVDIAMRISELGRQPYSSRRFFEKYQDRILFGTDSVANEPCDHSIYYRFFETFDEYFDYSRFEIPNQGRWKIYGIGLEPEILEKMYYKNAERILGI